MTASLLSIDLPAPSGIKLHKCVEPREIIQAVHCQAVRPFILHLVKTTQGQLFTYFETFAGGFAMTALGQITSMPAGA